VCAAGTEVDVVTAAQRVQLGLCAVVMAGVLAASVSGLAKVAQLVAMPIVTLPGLNGGPPLDLPVGAIGLILAWDGMQLCSGWAVHTARSAGALVLLVLTATASGAAQGWAGVVAVAGADAAASWVLLAIVFAVHASPAAFLIGAEYLTLTTAHRPAMPVAKPKPRPSPRPPAPARPVEVPATPLRSAPGPETQPLKPAARGKSLDELVADAHAAAERLGVPVNELSQRTLRGELGIGDTKVRELSRLLKGDAEDATPTDPGPVAEVLALSSNGARS
jgi:hypothetical protein